MTTETPLAGHWWEMTVESSEDLLLAATTRTGWLWHVLWDDPKAREPLTLGNTLLRGVALCGAKGKSGWQVRSTAGHNVKQPSPAYETMKMQYDRRPGSVCGECWNRLNLLEILRVNDPDGWRDTVLSRNSVSSRKPKEI